MTIEIKDGEFGCGVDEDDKDGEDEDDGDDGLQLDMRGGHLEAANIQQC